MLDPILKNSNGSAEWVVRLFREREVQENKIAMDNKLFLKYNN